MMRFRSEWLTLFTLTALVVAAWSWPGGGAAPSATVPAKAVAVAPSRHADIAAAGVDDMPVGTARTADRAKPVRARPQPVRP